MKFFSIRELTKSASAERLGIDNSPNEIVLSNLQALVDNILDPLRKIFGKPIIVCSGYRCEKLNTLIGGSRTSQHMKGQAADIQSIGDKDNRELFILCMTMEFDQLIWEYGDGQRPDWIHISWSENPRHQILKAKKVNGETVYERILQ